MPKILWRTWLRTLDAHLESRIDYFAHQLHRMACGILFI